MPSLEPFYEVERQRLRRRRPRFGDTPPVATIGAPYSWAPAVAGGLGPYVITLESGTLPDGLSLAANEITGTPAGPAGLVSIWLKIRDARLVSTSKKLGIAVRA